MDEEQLYFGGLPTEPDIKRIRDAFPDDALQTGDIIPYSEVGDVIGYPYGSVRFRTVTNRWRKMVERDCGKVVHIEKNLGFRINTPSQNLELSGCKLKSAVRMARRSFIVTGRIDRSALTEDELKRLDHQAKRSATMLASGQIKRTAELPCML